MNKTPAQFKVGDLVGHRRHPDCFGIVMPDNIGEGHEIEEPKKIFWWKAWSIKGTARGGKPYSWCLPINLTLLNRAEQR